MYYEDAGCDRPCGQEPMGCSTCELVTGYIPGIPFEDDFESDDDRDE